MTGENLEGLFCDTYPKELEGKVKQKGDHATFLNLVITIKAGTM